MSEETREYLQVKVENINESHGKRVEISSLINRQGQIGNQGFSREGIERILYYITQESFSNRPSLKDIIDDIKNSPLLLDKIKNFLENNPIRISTLPDGTVSLSDGHHRAFIAYQIGMTSLPIE